MPKEILNPVAILSEHDIVNFITFFTQYAGLYQQRKKKKKIEIASISFSDSEMPNRTKMYTKQFIVDIYAVSMSLEYFNV